MSAMQQEAQASPPSPIDSQQFKDFQPSDLQPAFSSPIDPPSHADSSLSPTSGQHLHIPMPPQLPPEMSAGMSHQVQSLFPTAIDPANVMSIPMDMSISALPPPPVDMSAMDVVSAPAPDSGPPGSLIQEFASQTASFAVDPRMNTLENIEGTRPQLSSPSATTSSTSVSHASSPAANGIASGYSAASSSLASALDASRSRSGSSASPGTLASSTSDLGFPSAAPSAPPTSAPDTGFHFPMAMFVKESSPELGGGAHLMVVRDLLKRIARQADNGSQACSNGHTNDARGIVDKLKRDVLLVVDLVQGLQLAEGSSQPAITASPHAHQAAAAATANSAAVVAAGVPGLEGGHGQVLNGLAYPTPQNALDAGAASDGGDMTRKRCASSLAGDRVLKAMKLEPQDDAHALQLPPASQSPYSASVFPFTAPIAALPTNVPALSDMAAMSQQMPPPMPSRPPSSAGMPQHHTMSILQDSGAPAPQPLHSAPPFFPSPAMSLDHAQAMPRPPVEFAHAASAPGTAAPAFATQMQGAPMWADGHVPVMRHHHSLSGGTSFVDAGLVHPHLPYGTAPPVFGSPPRSAQVHPPVPPALSGSSSASSLVRSSRSSSMSHTANPFAFSLAEPPQQQQQQAHAMYESRPSTSGFPSRPSSPEGDDDMDGEHDSDGEYDYSGGGGVKAESSIGAVPLSQTGRRMSRTSPSTEGGSGHGNEVPQEYRAEVERIFFQFLNRICSDLDASDAKGEPIHQTLMAKKMQRLDESPDFRPFKFRIQAFTNAFLEELASQGYPEDKIPMKKIRNYLWNQPYISRFNEEGKKSKSKGNHIWHVDAKKMADGGWHFRPFRRRLAGAPPGVAYVGLRWSWTPRIWDPQASRSNMPVKYSSPSLPAWLSWKDDVLSGVPTPDSQSCDVTVEARFMQDGKEELLTHTVHVTIAPVNNVDTSFAASRRPSLVGDIHNPRRIMSDSVVGTTAPARLLRTQPSLTALNPLPPTGMDTQVVQVLTTAAQRVAQEAQSQVVAGPSDSGSELQALAKQQHVLTVTAQVLNSKIAGDPQENNPQANALTAAAQQVVMQAARQVAADRSGLGMVQQQATVKEVSVATQSAVAQAVDMVGPLSSEVDVLMTAKSLLQQQTRPPLLEQHFVPPPPPLDAVRQQHTGTSAPPAFNMQPPIGVPVPPGPSLYFPST